MSVVVFFVLAALAAVAIGYPLLNRRVPVQTEAPPSSAQIAGAVQKLREVRRLGSQGVPPSTDVCPACSTPYQPGDRFCVRCGQNLAQEDAPSHPVPAAVCPSCGAALRGDDLFCARCGHRLLASSEDRDAEEVQS